MPQQQVSCRRQLAKLTNHVIQCSTLKLSQIFYIMTRLLNSNGLLQVADAVNLRNEIVHVPEVQDESINGRDTNGAAFAQRFSNSIEARQQLMELRRTAAEYQIQNVALETRMRDLVEQMLSQNLREAVLKVREEVNLCNCTQLVPQSRPAFVLCFQLTTNTCH